MATPSVKLCIISADIFSHPTAEIVSEVVVVVVEETIEGSCFFVWEMALFAR
jgi:hypothetical protein